MTAGVDFGFVQRASGVGVVIWPFPCGLFGVLLTRLRGGGGSLHILPNIDGRLVGQKWWVVDSVVG